MPEPHHASPDFVTIDPDQLAGQGAYHLLNAVVAPRPIAWVSTLSPDGVANVAPHSYFTILSPAPPILGFVSVGAKDTVRNIVATGEYVVNIASFDLREQVNLTAADFPPGESEFAWAGLTPAPSDLVRAPRVGEAPVAMETRLLEVKPVASSYLIIGEVVRWRLRRDILDNGRVDPARLQLFARHAGNGYSRTREFFEMARPTYAALSRQRASATRPSIVTPEGRS